MGKFTPHFLLLCCVIFFGNIINYAQETRPESSVRSRTSSTVVGIDNFPKVKNTIEEQPQSILPEKNKDKQLNVSEKNNTDSIVPTKNNNAKIAGANPKQIVAEKFISSQDASKSKDRNEIRTSENEKQNTNAVEKPIYLDLKAIGSKEVLYSDAFVSAETPHKQLERLTVVPADVTERHTPNAAENTNTAMSPLKRKYLEGVVANLENDIATKKYSPLEIKAKKKEIEELKLLLSKP